MAWEWSRVCANTAFGYHYEKKAKRDVIIIQFILSDSGLLGIGQKSQFFGIK